MIYMLAKFFLIWTYITNIFYLEHEDHAVFGQKLLNTQHGVGRCARKSPIMKWANSLKVFEKTSLKLNAASHNNTSWYTDTDGFLEHSPSRESLYYRGPTLQKIILDFWSPISYIYTYTRADPPPKNRIIFWRVVLLSYRRPLLGECSRNPSVSVYQLWLL